MNPGRDAWQLLKQVWMKQGPGRIILPVDPIEIARKMGIVVLDDDELKHDVAGGLRKEPGFWDPVILLNPEDTRERRRFTCADAIGHYSRYVEIGEDGAWDVNFERDPFAASSLDRAYATEFAFELLMPRAVLDEVDDRTAVAPLAARFAVTGDVMRARLDRMGWRR